jgi:hypothetical protein
MGAPVFIKIEEYKDTLDIIALLKNKIREGKEVIEKINRMKEEEDNEIASWSAELDEIAGKIDAIDKSLLKV